MRAGRVRALLSLSRRLPEPAMQVYLPIAEMSADALLLVGIGFGVGWLSGLFGWAAASC
jgi:hypothetical protein